MINKNSGLNTLKSLFPNAVTESGSIKSKYGKIEGDLLLYKGIYYSIDYVAPDTLIMKTDKLFGVSGDEFPLELIK